MRVVKLIIRHYQNNIIKPLNYHHNMASALLHAIDCQLVLRNPSLAIKSWYVRWVIIHAKYDKVVMQNIRGHDPELVVSSAKPKHAGTVDPGNFSGEIRINMIYIMALCLLLEWAEFWYATFLSRNKSYKTNPIPPSPSTWICKRYTP